MNNSFAENITMLRNKRGISQKAAAQKLGISQGLLSHYEKGVRECGLDFVIKAAEFYSVSCGYLLGVETDSDEKQISQNKLSKKGNRVVNGVLTVNEVAGKIGGETLCNKVNDMMSIYVYNTLRMLDKDGEIDAFETELSKSIINSSAIVQNSIAKISNMELTPIPKDFELHKDTEKLIKNVEQRIEM